MTRPSGRNQTRPGTSAWRLVLDHLAFLLGIGQAEEGHAHHDELAHGRRLYGPGPHSN